MGGAERVGRGGEGWEGSGVCERNSKWEGLSLGRTTTCLLPPSTGRGQGGGDREGEEQTEQVREREKEKNDRKINID